MSATSVERDRPISQPDTSEGDASRLSLSGLLHAFMVHNVRLTRRKISTGITRITCSSRGAVRFPWMHIILLSVLLLLFLLLSLVPLLFFSEAFHSSKDSESQKILVYLMRCLVCQISSPTAEVYVPKNATRSLTGAGRKSCLSVLSLLMLEIQRPISLMKLQAEGQWGMSWPKVSIVTGCMVDAMAGKVPRLRNYI